MSENKKLIKISKIPSNSSKLKDQITLSIFRNKPQITYLLLLPT